MLTGCWSWRRKGNLFFLISTPCGSGGPTLKRLQSALTDVIRQSGKLDWSLPLMVGLEEAVVSGLVVLVGLGKFR